MRLVVKMKTPENRVKKVRENVNHGGGERSPSCLNAFKGAKWNIGCDVKWCLK
ncbi:hypothetical protein ES703_26121 [subsurface metagenome]